MNSYYYLDIPVHESISELREEVRRAIDNPRLQPAQKRILKKAMNDCFRVADEVLALFSEFEQMHENWPTDDRFYIGREITRFSEDLHYDATGNRSSIRSNAREIATEKNRRELKFYANELVRNFADCKERLRTLAKKMQFVINEYAVERDEILRNRDLD